MSSLIRRKPLDGRGGEKQWVDSAQDRRVRNALKRQRTRRRDLSTHARRVATGTFQETNNPTNNNHNQNNTAMELEPIHPQNTTDSKSNHHSNPSNPSKSSKRSFKPKKKRQQKQESLFIKQKYAAQLSHHDWMISLPSDLSHRNINPGADQQVGWYVSPRPQGRRCLVTAHGGETTARDKNGTVIGRFQSALPNGSRSKGRKQRSNGDGSSFGSGYSILDCILQEEVIPVSNVSTNTFGLETAANQTQHKVRSEKIQRTYWVIDLMCWKGYSLYDCNVQFRTYWLQTKMAEEVDNNFNMWTQFKPIPRYECTPEGLSLSYNLNNNNNNNNSNNNNNTTAASTTTTMGTNTSCSKTDGLLFMHRNGHYSPGPIPTPLVLVWKDHICGASHFTSNNTGTAATTSTTTTSNEDLIILQVGANGNLLTQDEIQLGTVDLSTQNHQINDYLKFSLEHVTFDQNGRPRLINPIYMGKCNKNRTSAHTMSRIFFHHHDASNQLQLPTIEHLVQVAATPIMVEEQEEVNEEEDEEDYEEDQTMTDQ